MVSLTRHKAGLINYFLHPKTRVHPVEQLDQKLSDVLQLDLNSKELSLVLFHAASHAVKHGSYGDTKIAGRVVEGYVQAWTDKAINYSGLSNGFTISHMMAGFELLRLRPPERFSKFAEAKATGLMPEYTKSEIIYMLSAIARLGLYFDKEFYKAVQKRIHEVKDDFIERDFYRFFHQLAVIDAVNQKIDGNMRAPLQDIFHEVFDDLGTQQKLQQIDKDSCRAMMIDTTFWFKGDHSAPYPVQEEKFSSFEVNMATSFELAGAKIEASLKVPGTEHTIDLSASFNGAVFHVECDGPTHFVRSADDHKVFLNGHTIFQTSLINKRNPEQLLVRMPYDAYYQNRDNKKMAEDLLWRLSVIKSGSYLINEDWKLVSLTSGYDTKNIFGSTQAPRLAAPQ